MAELDSLVHRYVEDRGSLTTGELDELIAALRADPEFAITVREQLVLDDLLAQKFVLDRRNFVAQVEQRIADFNRGHELSQQVADLRSMAAAETIQPAPSALWRLTQFVVAVVALVAIAVGIWAALTATKHHSPAMATIKSFEGDVKIEAGSQSSAAEIDLALEGGQRIVVPRGGSIVFTYNDGTELRVKGDSAITFGEEQPGGAKQIRIEQGEVVVNVKLQAGVPMRLMTPHAVATASAALLRLVVADESTLLDVSEGKVKFDRLADRRTLMVAANESGLASRDTFQIRDLTWPDRRDGLSYLFSPLTNDSKPLAVVRHPETRHLRVMALEPRGEATLLDSRMFYELNGGYLISSDAGPDIFANSRGGSEFALEAIFSPANLNQAGPVRILSLADDENDDPDFALAQDGADVMFSLRTDAKPAPASPQRLAINSADSPVHVTVTYRNGELIVYRDGMEIARSKDLWGSLAAWRSGPLTVGANAGGDKAWRGIMEAFALYNRCLEPGEVARNARNYRLLAGRGM